MVMAELPPTRELFDRYGAMVYRRCAAILRSDEAARDAVQEVFLRVIERRRQYRGESSPSTWLYAVATLHCLQQLRDQAGRIAKLAQLSEQPPDKSARSPEERLAVAKLLDGEPDDVRLMVYLHYVDGMTLTGNRSNTQLNDIEEVQVFKGPNSVLYGGSASGQGGMINVIRKKPSGLRANEIQYRLGRWGLQQVSGASTGSVFHMERLLYRVDASYAHSDGWRQAGAKRFTVGPKLTWLIGPRMSLSTTQTFTRDRFNMDAAIPFALLGREEFPFDRRLNPPGDFQLSRDWQNKVDFLWNITNRLTIKNTFFKRVNRDQYLNAETLTYVAASDQVTRGLLYFQHNRRPLQDITEITGDYTILGMRHRVMARYDFSDQYNFTNRTGPTPGSNTQSNMPLPAVPVPEWKS